MLGHFSSEQRFTSVLIYAIFIDFYQLNASRKLQNTQYRNTSTTEEEEEKHTHNNNNENRNKLIATRTKKTQYVLTVKCGSVRSSIHLSSD